jgi:putative ABC transport system substrate-binding protein
MVAVGNPEQTGLVMSIARPGGNITGTSFFFADLNAKRLQLIKEGIPSLRRVAALTNPDNLAHTSVLAAMTEMTQSLRLDLHTVQARRHEDLEAAVTSARQRADALAVIDDGMFIANAHRIAELASRHRLPTIGFRELVDSGGLLAYAVDFPAIFGQSMTLVDKILRGAEAGNLPILQASRFELVVNLKASKALGLTISPSLLLRADRLLE